MTSLATYAIKLSNTLNQNHTYSNEKHCKSNHKSFVNIVHMFLKMSIPKLAYIFHKHCCSPNIGHNQSLDILNIDWMSLIQNLANNTDIQIRHISCNSKDTQYKCFKFDLIQMDNLGRYCNHWSNSCS